MATMQRASYNLIIKKYQARKMGNVRLTQSSLILLQPLSSDSKTYTFQLLDTEGQPLPTEIRLNLNDEFTSYEMGYYLQGTRSVVGQTPVQISNIFWTYAPIELKATLQALDEAWNARMAIEINNIKRLEKWDMLKHRIVQRTQYTNYSAGIPNATQPSTRFENDGCVTMQPMITFSGAKKNLVTISCVTSISGSTVFDQTIVDGTLQHAIQNMCLIYRGMLAQNAAKFQ